MTGPHLGRAPDRHVVTSKKAVDSEIEVSALGQGWSQNGRASAQDGEESEAEGNDRARPPREDVGEECRLVGSMRVGLQDDTRSTVRTGRQCGATERGGPCVRRTAVPPRSSSLLSTLSLSPRPSARPRPTG